MAPHPGYARSRTRRERSIDRAWAMLQEARATGEWLTTADLAQRSGASGTVCRHLVRASRDAGWLMTQPGAYTQAGRTSGIHKLKSRAPKTAPVLRRPPRGEAWRVEAVIIAGPPRSPTPPSR